MVSTDSKKYKVCGVCEDVAENEVDLKVFVEKST
jgi:hypothetical protein